MKTKEGVDYNPEEHPLTFYFKGKERLASMAILIPTGIIDLTVRSIFTNPGLVSSYGHDIIVGFASYHLFKVLHINPDNKALNATLGFLMPASQEIAQALGLRNGTFDWADFIAYGIGIGTALLAEKKSKSSSDKPSKSPSLTFSS